MRIPVTWLYVPGDRPERFAGAAGTYTGVTVPGPHRFDIPMQERAVEFLTAALST